MDTGEFTPPSGEGCSLEVRLRGRSTAWFLMPDSDRIEGMHAHKVQVTNGRLVMDEPTDLPDGAEVEIVVIGDDLTAEERAELHASLDRALEDSDAGRGMDAWEYLERYRAERENRTAR